ncbi:helix-turn-helix domain-containing protein [Flavobacterium sp. KBS0721]|uniref:helix-turn-helix domain-containing protein n=1 Tax=Flavobacterium sp. KBS0721 TaxID=1179672 RepID=UPI00098EE168|nr:helix-turn-helix transcriptional regulator [Flavobacterium sp. KBS0721]QDW21082.1 helix-turn-helix transcriptional regulator [Flavobacterium sp. KBS0721]
MAKIAFYLKIKEYREKKYTQEYMAIQMEISLREYQKIETGKVDLKLSKLDKLGKIFGIKKSDFFKEENF